jgi:hypothetical protein
MAIAPISAMRVMAGPTESNGSTGAAQNDIPTFAPQAAMICRKQKLLVAEMRKYFRQKCEEIKAKLEELTFRLTPLVQGELASQLLGLKALSSQTDQKLSAARGTASADGASFERLLDRTIAAMEHLSDGAEALVRYLDELFENPQRNGGCGPLMSVGIGPPSL